MSRQLHKVNENYPANHWLLTVSVAPVAAAVAMLFSAERLEDADNLLYFLPFALFGGLVGGLPCFLIYWLSFSLLTKGSLSGIVIKLVLNLLLVFLIFLTFFLAGTGETALIFGTLYAASAVIASLFLRVRSRYPLPGQD